MDLSVIIPVYNTPLDLLEKCFDSIQLEGLIEWEAIIIDDGSNSGVGEYCADYVERHPEFRYFYQKNNGVSSARNAGIRHAAGHYIMFVDADDELVAESLTKKALDCGADIIFFDTELIENRHARVIETFPGRKIGNICKKSVTSAAFLNRLNSVWSKLYSRELLIKNKLQFDVDMVIAEDALFALNAIIIAETMYYSNAVIYKYIRPFGSDRGRILRFPQKTVGNLIQLYQARKECLENCGVRELFSAAEIQGLNVKIATLVVRDLMATIGVQALLGIDCGEVREKVVLFLEELEQKFGSSLPWKTQMQCRLLKQNKRAVIKLYASLREVYIRRNRT